MSTFLSSSATSASPSGAPAACAARDRCFLSQTAKRKSRNTLNRTWRMLEWRFIRRYDAIQEEDLGAVGGGGDEEEELRGELDHVVGRGRKRGKRGHDGAERYGAIGSPSSGNAGEPLEGIAHEHEEQTNGYAERGHCKSRGKDVGDPDKDVGYGGSFGIEALNEEGRKIAEGEDEEREAEGPKGLHIGQGGHRVTWVMADVP
ncbi:hypothetical protein K438DRAFT_1937054 [Mycena galopus ATCC 62051]|nr:hypothetical protein K438DRAFT_1937054 [Mycena galopus ATCC 62051]